ncbi:esterase lipase [Stemphylium lycopersici]|nr:esterase lipase [Stemphylium lycopersici]
MAFDTEFLEAIAPLLEAQGTLAVLPIHDVEGRRARFNALRRPLTKLSDDVSYQIVNIASTDGLQIPVHCLKRQQPEGSGSSVLSTAAAIHAHGGGLISMSPEISIERLANAVRDTGVQVFSVEYRLAPEHQYPAALDDFWACLMWLHSEAETLGIDPERIAVMGDSAGGGLAAAATLRARQLALSPPIAIQILGSPMLDDRTVADTEGFSLWNAADNLTGWTAYLGRVPGADNIPIFAAPGRMTDAKDLPPLYLDCGQLDIFAKENLSYVQKFVHAGVATEFHLYPGLPHGFDALVPTHRVSQQLDENRKRVLNNLQDRVPKGHNRIQWQGVPE